MESAEGGGTDIQARILISTLEEVASRNQEGDGDHSECCVVCLDVIKEPCEAWPCQHYNFDFVCLINWLEQQPRCPLCKASITEVRYDFEGPDRRRWNTFVPETKRVAASSPEVATQHRPRPHRRDWPRHRLPRRRDYSSPVRAPSEDEAVVRRRQIYRDGLYSLHIGTNRITRYRELAPQLFEQDPDLVSRARMWLRRELKVFEFLHSPTQAQQSTDAVTRRRANNAEFLLEYIIAILKTVDIQGSQGQAEDMLQEFLGRDHTRLLLHELKSFLRSPFMSLEAWDRAVQYPTTTPRKERSLSPASDPRPASSGTSLTVRQGNRVHKFRGRGDSYRPQYSSSSHGQVGSARRPRGN
jgi:hypothetical protein